MLDPTGATAFWEITSAAHIDYPEQARVELVDNGDGTLSFFATVLKARRSRRGRPRRPVGARAGGVEPELSANDPQVDGIAKLGTALDLNVELVLRNPRPAICN